MIDKAKTKKQLIEEMEHLRRRIMEMERAVGQNKRDGKANGYRNERLEEDLQKARELTRQREKEVAALLESTKAIIADKKFVDAARIIFCACKNFLEAGAGYISLLSKDGKENVVLYLDSGGLACTLDSSLLMPVGGLRTAAFKSGRPRYINNFADSRWARFVPEGHVPVENVMFAPIKYGATVAGLIGLANKPDGFGKADAATVMSFCGIASAALQNNRNLELLKNSEKLYRSVVETAGSVILCLSPDHRITEFNREAEKVFGWSKEEVLGKDFMELFLPREAWDEVDADIRKVLGGLPAYGIEKTLCHRDGSQRILLWNVTRLTDEQGWVTGIIASGQDITERKVLEENMMRTLQRLVAHMDNSPLAVVEFDPLLRVIRWSRNAERIFGWTPEEIIGRSISEMRWVYDEDEELVCLESAGLLNGECSCSHNINRNYRKDGSVIYCEWYNSAIYDSQGGMVSILSQVNDITEHRRAEDVLKESEERYRTLLNSVTDYIYTVRIEDGSSVSTSHGPGCLAVTGYRPKELDEDPYLWYNMIYPDDKESVRNLIKSIISEETIQPLEHRIIHRDGSLRWVRNTSVRKYDIGGRLVAYDGMISDITDRKKLEAQLFHAQKMESIGILAGGIAHDFNNVLTAITGFADILKTRMPDDDPLRIYAGYIEEAAENAVALTRNLLMFSRKHQVNPITVNISEVIGRMKTMMQRIMGEDIELRLSFDGDGLYARADVGQIEQVIMNLATNARDAMPGGGMLTITTESFIMDEYFERHHGYGKSGQYALVTISDTGTGMDERTREKIFEPFFTTKEVNRGTGLGLSIVYGIIKQHNGYISVDSMPGKGTVFKLYLPMQEKAGDVHRPAPESEATLPSRGSETILFAEDDRLVRSYVVNILSDSGYKIIEAGDGEEAVSKFIKNQDRIQFVILDAIMPRKNGGDVYKEIKSLRPDIKGIFLSGHMRDKVDIKEIDKGFKFIAKPVKPHQLLKIIREGIDINEEKG